MKGRRDPEGPAGGPWVRLAAAGSARADHHPNRSFNTWEPGVTPSSVPEGGAPPTDVAQGAPRQKLGGRPTFGGGFSKALVTCH